MKENIQFKGWVTIETIDADGKVIDVVEGPNLITNAGRLNAEKLLGGTPEGKPITKIAFGTNGTVPDATDTAITGALVKDVNTVSYGTGNTVVFETNIDAADPAMTIREVGLLNQDDVLCHRKVFDPAKEKVAGLAYHITYKIKVV